MPNRLFTAVLISGVCAASAVYAQSPPTSAQLDARLNAAWNANVAAAESAAISGPDQLKAAKALQEAVQAWSADRNAQLAVAQKERDEAKREATADQGLVKRYQQQIEAAAKTTDRLLAEQKAATEEAIRKAKTCVPPVHKP